MAERAYQRPETVPIKAEVKDWTGTYIDPTTSIKISIYNPSGTLVVDSIGMSKEDGLTGKYVYYHNTVIADPLGWYKISVAVIDGTDDTAKTTIAHGGFMLQ